MPLNQFLEPLIENVGLVGNAGQNLLKELFVARALMGLQFNQFLQPSIDQISLIGDAFAHFRL